MDLKIVEWNTKRESMNYGNLSVKGDKMINFNDKNKFHETWNEFSILKNNPLLLRLLFIVS